MHILCVCQGGNTRSVAMACRLKEKYHLKDVIAIGTRRVSPETFEMMGNWADKIFVVGNEKIVREVPQKFRSKITLFDIGRDIWHNPMNKELQEIIRKELEKIRFIS